MVDELPVWMVQGFVARGQLIEAREDLNRAQSSLLPRLKTNDVRNTLGQLRRRVTNLINIVRPPKKKVDIDYTAEWARLSQAQGGVMTNKGEK